MDGGFGGPLVPLTLLQTIPYFRGYSSLRPGEFLLF